MLKKNIYNLGNSGTYLLDGFPRNHENLDKWNEIIGDEMTIKNMIYFECEP